MAKINERVLNEKDIAPEDEVKRYKVSERLPEYGEIEIPKSWINPPSLLDLQHDIEYALIDHHLQVTVINEFLDYYHTTPGVGRPHKQKGRSNAQPMSIRKAAEWRYSSLSEPFLDSPELFKGEPTTASDIDGTKQSTFILNFQFKNQIDLVGFIDDYIKDLVDIGTAIIRTSWEVKEISKEVEQDVVEYIPAPELEPLYAQLMQIAQQSPDDFKAVPDEIKLAFRKSFEVGQAVKRKVLRTETVTVIETVKNQPKVDICDYRDVIPDPTCRGEQEDMQFCGFRLRTTKAELADDPRYFNLDKIVVATASALMQHHDLDAQGEVINQDSDTFQFKDPNRQPIEGMEYWGFVDVDESGVMTPVVFTWFGDVLVRAEENPYPDKKIPFTFVPYLKIRNSLYGEPDGALLHEDQKVSGAITRGVIDILAKNANGQQGIPKGALDYNNLILYRAGKDYEYNPTTQQGRDGITSITKFPEIPQSALAIQQLAESNIKEMTGTLPGQASENHGNALGTQLEQSQAAGMSRAARRELGILRRVSAGIVIVGHKICAMNKEFLEEDQVIRITDESFLTVNKGELDCKYDLKLTISTAEDDSTKAQELAFMLQTATGVMDADFIRLLLADIADLRRMPDKAKFYRQYQPKPDPHAEELKKLELAKLQSEVDEIISRTEENRAEAQRETANAENLRAQAKLALAKADAIDLKYVEDDQGLTHERELEKAQAQAEGNMRLESHRKALELGEKEADKENKLLDQFLEPNKPDTRPLPNRILPPPDLTNRGNIGTNTPGAPTDNLMDALNPPVAPAPRGNPQQFSQKLDDVGNMNDLLNPGQ